MKTLKTKLAVCASVTALIAAPAFAQNFASNNQSNWAETRAELNANLENIQGDVVLTAAAISNSMTADLSGTSVVDNTQSAGLGRHRVNTKSIMNVVPKDELDALTATSAAITNSASITVEDSIVNTWINNNQNANANTTAILNAHLVGVAGEADLTAAAVANSLTIEDDFPVGLHNRQITRGSTTTDLNIYADGELGSLTATAAAIGNSASITWENGAPDAGSLTNRQHLNGNVYSELELYGEHGVHGDVEVVNAAIANSISVEGVGDYYANNHQTFRGDVAADTIVALDDVAGAVDVTTAAIGNSASYQLADAKHVGITNWQRANIDPRANAFIDLDGVDGNVNVTTAAIANSFAVSTLPDVSGMTINSTQENNAYTAAVTTVDLVNIVGDVTLTSAAIGNSVNISNLPN